MANSKFLKITLGFIDLMTEEELQIVQEHLYECFDASKPNEQNAIIWLDRQLREGSYSTLEIVRDLKKGTGWGLLETKQFVDKRRRELGLIKP